MAKKIIYTYEFGNQIDVNTVEGIHTILNDVFVLCETENACMCVKENVNASVEKCYKTRIQEIKAGELQDKSI